MSKKEYTTDKSKETGKNLKKHLVIGAIIIVLVGGFGYYCYYKIDQWMRYYSIEQTEQPITDYRITKIYSDETSSKKPRRSEDDRDKDINYYMDVSYNGKDYKLNIDEYIYSGSKEITLYYDAEGDNVFLAGTGGGNLLVLLIAAVVLGLVLVIIIIYQLAKAFKKKEPQKPKEKQPKNNSVNVVEQ